jgi:hypothetical protein
MHEDNFHWLGESDLRAPTQSVAADGPLLSDTGSAQEPQPSIGADPEPYDLGEDDDGADDDGLSDSEDYGGPGRVTKRTPSSWRRRFEQRAIRNSRTSG